MRIGAGSRGVAAAAAIVGTACGGAAPDPPPAGPNAVVAENALPGDDGWRLHERAGPGQLEGYASEASVEHGETVHVHVRSDVQRTLSWKLYRMGWYGGVEGRLVASGGPVPVGPQPAPAPSADTGLVECRWPVTFEIATQPSWTSGVFLVAMTRDDGPQSYVVFVVRDGRRKGAAVFQASFTTYQAYNWWGGTSLYDPRSAPAQEVSFDRPYADENGAGQFFKYEHHFVRWAEKRGYDLVYATGLDLDRDPSILLGQKLFLSVGHDEYWSAPSRGALEAAIASGVSAAFFSANAIYWQIRLEPAKGGGAPRRTQVCYKRQSARDPMHGTPLETVQWRQPPVNRPENALLGIMYTCWMKADADWVVRNAGSWVYEGTGAKDGDAIRGLVGDESDRTVDNGQTPPGTVTLSRSPVTDVTGRSDSQEAAVHDDPSGAFVFAAGTMQWSWGLSREGYVDARVQRMTENVFRRAGLEPSAP